MWNFQTRINLCYEMLIWELDRFSEEQKFYFLKELFQKYHMSRHVFEPVLKRLKEEGQKRSRYREKPDFLLQI